ncbi:hypothetical protein LQZ24_01050 [Fructobacillus sp. M1-13]|uniref:Uncharacterized protein n=1 Tax=Fructobacillus papyriferae TaxID=2713171 RepID=A0ABS5QNE3_9LACO|nr:hypothetical protein [Fructobacillus papyriferae]MBS9334624.1 hypothetical protein [Fructobacillus papyriferae]MCD2158614.1 hypothetical protein [Fructobacillus papyriferae]
MYTLTFMIDHPIITLLIYTFFAWIAFDYFSDENKAKRDKAEDEQIQKDLDNIGK